MSFKRGCTSKARFESYTQAERVAKRKKRKGSRRKHPYRCRYCRGFHLTTERTYRRPRT